VRWQSAVHENVQYSKTLVKKYQCGIMCIVKLAVGYIVFGRKQIALMADEKRAEFFHGCIVTGSLRNGEFDES